MSWLQDHRSELQTLPFKTMAYRMGRDMGMARKVVKRMLKNIPKKSHLNSAGNTPDTSDGENDEDDVPEVDENGDVNFDEGAGRNYSSQDVEEDRIDSQITVQASTSPLGPRTRSRANASASMLLHTLTITFRIISTRFNAFRRVSTRFDKASFSLQNHDSTHRNASKCVDTCRTASKCIETWLYMCVQWRRGVVIYF